LDYLLADDFEANSHAVKVVDRLVFNDYKIHKSQWDPHKSFGLLTHPWNFIAVFEKNFYWKETRIILIKFGDLANF